MWYLGERTINNHIKGVNLKHRNIYTIEIPNLGHLLFVFVSYKLINIRKKVLSICTVNTLLRTFKTFSYKVYVVSM